MARVKGGPKSSKRRKNILAMTKGYRFARSKKKKAAKEAIVHAGKYAFRDRKAKKRVMRSSAIISVNAGVRALGFKSYSTFIDTLKKHGSTLNRKMLAELAKDHPEAFERVVKKITP